MLPQATPLHVRLICLILFYLPVLKSAKKKWFEGSLSIKYRIYLWLGCFITLTPPPKRLVCYHQFLFSQKFVHASMNGTGCQTKVLDLKNRILCHHFYVHAKKCQCVSNECVDVVVQGLPSTNAQANQPGLRASSQREAPTSTGCQMKILDWMSTALSMFFTCEPVHTYMYIEINFLE